MKDFSKITNLKDRIDLKGYFSGMFFPDLRAGFITAVVALPLAIAFALASGVPAEYGIYTAIVAGILGSLFGGSKFSITGPTGAMAVIILAIVNKYGMEGLFLAGLIAGLIQVIFGIARVGRFVKFIPLPIITGFTAGIGAIIFIGQIPNLLGLRIPAKEHVWDTFFEIFKELGSISTTAILVGLATILILVFFPKIFGRIRFLKDVPASFIALALTTFLAFYFNLAIPQVGEVPVGVPKFALFSMNWSILLDIMPSALTIALLGMLESLLCAVVCDSMTKTHHKSDQELISQGAVNMINPFFSAIPSTAAVARSAVSVREGAKSRFAGVYHALFLLIIVLFFGPIAKYIPKAFLAGVLMFVSWKMISVHEFKAIMSVSRKDTLVLFATFLLTIFTDLVFAVQMGFLFAVFLLFYRTTGLLGIVTMDAYGKDGEINRLVSKKALDGKVSVYTIHGPLFFGTLSTFDKKSEERIRDGKPFLVLRMKHVSFMDSTGVERLKSYVEEKRGQGKQVYLTSLRWRVDAVLKKDGFFKKMMNERLVFEHTSEAILEIEKRMRIGRLVREKKEDRARLMKKTK